MRIDGPLVSAFLAHHFRARPRLGRCVHGALVDDGKTLDDPVVVLIAPDRADLNLHGGPWVVQSVLNLLDRSGFKRTDPHAAPAPEQVDARSLLEREMLAALPGARTELALRVLLAQPDAWREAIGELRHADAEKYRQRCADLLGDRALQHLLATPHIAIVGPPNAGKSTLANQLFATERSITADLPGTTRDWVGEIANIDGLAAMLVDTPGIRDTDDPIEREAIARGEIRIGSADLVLLVLDGTRPLLGPQQALLDRFPAAIRLVNKVDMQPAFSWEGLHALGIAARSGEGVGAVRRRILRHFNCWQIAPHAPRCWTTRQWDLLERALDDPLLLPRLLDEPAQR